MPRAYAVHAVEAKWRDTWNSASCFHAPDVPGADKFFNFDSGPFPNGPLHLGHVRTYALGDMTARYQRLQGKIVLYGTDWDAFGLPNETAAREAGVDPREFTSANIARMRDGLERLGVSYDWRRVHATCDPRYYRWTQTIFVELFKRGLVERRNALAAWCPACESSLAAMQAAEGTCWRCGSAIEWRREPQWFILTSQLTERLRQGIATLEGWSDTGRRLLQRGLADLAAGPGEEGRAGDWQVSRQRAWGTPIPIVHCQKCGAVPADPLPVELPAEVDWSLGPDSLRRCESFALTPCPQCHGPAQRESDTLDCFFDDSWSLFSCVVELEQAAPFPSSHLAAWFPVDRFHSGFDTFGYLNLYRVVGFALHDAGLLPCGEPIASYRDHDMVLSGGRKMSKHLGNAVDPATLIEDYGADALRLATLGAAGPERSLDWQNADPQRAADWLDRLFVLTATAAPVVTGWQDADDSGESKAAIRLGAELRKSWRRIAAFVDDYRPNAGIHELEQCLTRLEDFTLHRIVQARLGPTDARSVGRLLHEFAIVLSPFAPFLAEELAAKLGAKGLIAQSRWPG